MDGKLCPGIQHPPAPRPPLEILTLLFQGKPPFNLENFQTPRFRNFCFNLKTPFRKGGGVSTMLTSRW